MKHIISICCAFFFINCVYSNTVRVSVPTFEIIDGNCSNAALNDLVFDVHDHLERKPFVSREDRVSSVIIFLIKF